MAALLEYLDHLYAMAINCKIPKVPNMVDNPDRKLIIVLYTAMAMEWRNHPIFLNTDNLSVCVLAVSLSCWIS